jgi:hypothetical protein
MVKIYKFIQLLGQQIIVQSKLSTRDAKSPSSKSPGLCICCSNYVLDMLAGRIHIIQSRLKITNLHIGVAKSAAYGLVQV